MNTGGRRPGGGQMAAPMRTLTPPAGDKSTRNVPNRYGEAGAMSKTSTRVALMLVAVAVTRSWRSPNTSDGSLGRPHY